jgi:hypothetical protein
MKIKQHKRTSLNWIKQFVYILVGLLFVTPLTMLAQQSPANKTLKDVYKDAFLLGVAVTPAITSGADKALQDIVIKHFNSVDPVTCFEKANEYFHASIMWHFEWTKNIKNNGQIFP